MKLTYFVGPYDLLNHKTLRPTPMTIEGMSDYYVCCICVVGWCCKSAPSLCFSVPMYTYLRLSSVFFYLICSEMAGLILMKFGRQVCPMF